MAPSVFLDKTQPPGAQDLVRVLGRSKRWWDDIAGFVAQQYGPITETWGFSGKKYGWSLGLKQKKRSILYLVPGQKTFICSFALNEKAATEARARRLPANLLKMIEGAPRYPEGRAVRMEIKTVSSVESAKKLITVKMEV